jgi:fructuronate reductase
MAYLGALAGLDSVADAMARPELRRFASGLMLEEAAPTLPPGAPDAPAYAQALLARWSNPAIRHRLVQIAMDGSRKLPQRLLEPLAHNLAAGRPAPRTLLAVAAWIRWASGRGLAGESLDVQDPLAPAMAAIGQAAGGDRAALVDGFLRLADVFGPAPGAALREGLLAALDSLHEHGPLDAASRA